MRFSISSLGSLALFTSAVTALTITSPAAGAAIDPTQPIEIQWTSDSSDPSTIDLSIGQEGSTGGRGKQTLASGVDTSTGSFTIPANTIQSYGTGYQIQALSAGETDALAAATGLTLSPFQGSVSTGSDGQLTLTSQPTTQSAITAPTSLQSATGVTILSGTATPDPTGTTAATSARSTGFITSSVSRSSSEEASAAATSADTSNTANGQLHIRGSEVVLGAAGVLAGLVALVA